MFMQQTPADYFCQYPLFPLKTYQQKANRLHKSRTSGQWLFYYVDNGQLEMNCGHRFISLTQSEGILLEPHTPHSILTFQNDSASYLRLEFKTNSKEFRILRNKRLSLPQRTRRILETILEESKKVNFENEKDTLNGKTDLCMHSGNYASSSLIRLLTDQLLIELKRSYYSHLTHNSLWLDSYGLLTSWEERAQRDRHYRPLDYPAVANLRTLPQTSETLEPSNIQLFNRIANYLKDHIYGKITLDLLVEEFRFSKTHLTHIFKKCSGKTILAYYNDLKIEEAKRLILDTDQNLSQISDQLEFSSVHYFSRLFKKKAGMMPSEYRQTIIK